MKNCIKTLLLGSVAALGLTSAAQAQDKTLTISVYGFSQDAFKDILYDPFEEICGCTLVVETGNSVERLAKMETHKDDPIVDMAVMAHFDAAQADQMGLTQPIDVSKLTNYDKLFDIVKDPIGGHMAVGYTAYATSIVYRTDKVSIDSWDDLFSDELKGRVAVPSITTTQGAITLKMIGEAMGDTDPTFAAPMAKLGEHRDDIVTFYERTSSVIQLLQQDEIWAVPIGRFAWQRISTLDVPIGWADPKEGQTGGMNVMVMTKGTKNEDLALQFMDYWLSTEIQTKLAEGIIDSPVNSEVTVSPEIAANLTYGADTINGLKLIPAQTYLEYREGWIDTWNTTVAQ